MPVNATLWAFEQLSQRKVLITKEQRAVLNHLCLFEKMIHIFIGFH